MRKYFLNKRGTNNKLLRPRLPRDGPGTPEGSRKWASLSFYRGQGRGFHCGTFRKAQCTNQHVFRPSHTQFIGGAELDEDGGGVTA